MGEHKRTVGRDSNATTVGENMITEIKDQYRGEVYSRFSEEKILKFDHVIDCMCEITLFFYEVSICYPCMYKCM